MKHDSIWIVRSGSFGKETMAPALISALTVLFGSVVGGSASVATTWLTQHAADRRKLLSMELKRRETLYSDFISECSKLLIDSLDHTLDKPETLVSVYSLFNRIRLVSSSPVVAAAYAVVDHLIKGYFRPNLTLEEIRDFMLQRNESAGHPLAQFSIACRRELDALQRGRMNEPSDPPYFSHHPNAQPNTLFERETAKA